MNSTSHRSEPRPLTLDAPRLRMLQSALMEMPVDTFHAMAKEDENRLGARLTAFTKARIAESDALEPSNELVLDDEEWAVCKRAIGMFAPGIRGGRPKMAAELREIFGTERIMGMGRTIK